MKVKVNERILQYPQGGEWMMGQEFKIIEELDEDGMKWYVGTLNVPCSGSNFFKLPEFALDFTDEVVPVEVLEPVLDEKDMAKGKTPINDEDSVETTIKPFNEFCKGVTKSGNPCKRRPVNGGEYCKAHGG